jgi:putative transposase
LAELKNRGISDVCMVVCDGLKGLPAAIETVWPQAITQTCIVHLLRNSFRYASKKDWPAIAKDLKPIYTAPSESGALDAFVAFTEQWGSRNPAIIRVWEKIIKVWEKVWPEFLPFLQFDTSIRMVVCTTNAIESINSRIRRAVNARGHFLPSRPRLNACIWRS